MADRPTFSVHNVSDLHICSVCGAAVAPGYPLRTHIAWHANQSDSFSKAITKALSLYNVATKVPRVKDCA